MSGFETYAEIQTALRSGQEERRVVVFGNVGRKFTQWVDLFGVVKFPGGVAGSHPTPALTAVAYTHGDVGSIVLRAPRAGNRQHLVEVVHAVGCSHAIEACGTMLLHDRLLAYGGIDHTIATLQNMTNGVGLPRKVSGLGVRVALVASTARNAATQRTLTVTYTNEHGDGGRTGTIVVPVSTGFSEASWVVSTADTQPLFMTPQAGDFGVQSIESAQFDGTSTAGVSDLTLVYPITMWGNDQYYLNELAGFPSDGPSAMSLIRERAVFPILDGDECLSLFWVIPGTNPFHDNSSALVFQTVEN